VEQLDARGCRFVTFEDWLKLDALELAAGERCGRPRLKFTSVDDMLSALDEVRTGRAA
jgi:hypothetical protein